MIDFELAFINTEHPDFARLKRDLLPLITKALGVNPVPPLDTAAPALVPAAASSTATTTMSDTVQVTDYHKITTPKVKISQVDSPPSKSSVQSDNNEESGPFWQHWWGEQGHKAQPKPRRGGRRSSFAIMDASELEAFRQSQFNPEPTSPVQSKHQLSHNKSTTVAVTSEDTTLDLVKEMIKAYFSIVVRDITDKVFCVCVCVCNLA
jgi:hypothetical protein